MINQRAYPDVLLGFSNQSVAGYGCNFVAILDDLNTRFGYNFSVRDFMKYMNDREAWVRPNLISAPRMAETMPEIFLEGRSEAWNDAKVIEYVVTKRDQYIVIGEVDARGIGGSGQHFVKIDSVDVSNGKITMTYVDDGWDGLENQKVTKRYNAYGNIKSLRVYKVKKKASTGNGGSMSNMYKGYDLANPDSMKVAVDEMLKKINGVYVAKTDMDKALSDQKTQLNKEKDTALKQAGEDADKRVELAKKAGFDEGYAKGKSEGGTAPAPSVQIPSDFAVNGIQTTEVVNGVTVTKNYAKKG